jgi:hypothetical protein
MTAAERAAADHEARMETVDPNFDQFEAESRALGYDEVLQRDWPPLKVLEPHVHPFGARALVVRGEMWLTVGDETRHLRPGARFEVAAGTLHAERYGADGATYWVGRRSVSA